MQEVINNFINIATTAGLKLLWAVVILVVGIKCSKWASKLVLNPKRLPKLDEGVRRFFSNTLRITLYVVVIISAAGMLGIPYASFITVLGSAGVAIGLALQGSLSNIAGGILILVTRPFRVGDYIDAVGISGTVEEIGFFTTTLITVDNKKVSVPNGTLSNSCITNYSAMETRRVDLTFSVGYGSDIEKVKSILLGAASSNEKALKEPAPFAGLLSHGDSALVFALRVWCRSADYWDVNFALTEEVKRLLDENGVEIPFPKLDVTISR